MMAKRPDQRCQSPGEVASTLVSLAGQTDWRATAKVIPSSTPGRHQGFRRVLEFIQRRPLHAGVALLLLCLLFFFWLLWHTSRPPAGNRTDSKSPVVAQPLKPLPPTLIVQCGRDGGKNQNEVAAPGYSCVMVQGNVFDGWEGSPKRHCWYDGAQVRFDVTVPPGTAGVLRLYCLDADSAGRKQKIYVRGKLIDEVGKFGPPGKLVEVPLSAADTQSGKIDVLLERTGEANAVVSTVEFAPYPAGKP
jgi:hypothetical protein